MNRVALSPGELERARRRFVLFALLNVVSFTLLSGNIISLYVLRLGAGSFLVGLLSSFMYGAFLFLLVGQRIGAKWGMVPLMGRFWVSRYLLMLPILLSPLFVFRGHPRLASALVIFSVLGFNVARGIAIAAYNPILGQIAGEQDRGAFLGRVQLTQHSVNLLLGVAMALILGTQAPLYVYALFIAAGITTGLIAASLIFALPEPPPADPRRRGGLFRELAEAFSGRTFRTFIILYFCTSLLTYMAAPFFVVYFKRVYLQPDNAVMFFLVFASLGAVLMALASGFLIDKLGAKPLFILFFAVQTLVLIPLALSPAFPGLWAARLFAAAVMLFFSLGQFGFLNAAQVYFLSAIEPRRRLNLGVIFFLTMGIAGGLGSVLGGGALKALEGWIAVGGPFAARILGEAAGIQTRVFQLYFGVLAALSAAVLLFLGHLENLGAYPIRDALAAIFSPRDLRAISLVHRLNRVRSVEEEKRTLKALGASQSALSLPEVLARLRSPRFTIRAEALQALAALPLDHEAVAALISEVKNHAYTTAYLAADILGRRGLAQGIPALRRSLTTGDFFLQGKAMVALAQLGDRDSLPTIRRIIAHSANPRVIIHAAAALEILADGRSAPLLLRKLRAHHRPFLRDEIILSLAGIAGIGRWFYPLYERFLSGAAAGIGALRDVIDSAGSPALPVPELRELLTLLPQRDKASFCAAATRLLRRLPAAPQYREARIFTRALAEALTDGQLMRLERLLFFVAAFIIQRAASPDAGGPEAAAR